MSGDFAVLLEGIYPKGGANRGSIFSRILCSTHNGLWYYISRIPGSRVLSSCLGVCVRLQVRVVNLRLEFRTRFWSSIIDLSASMIQFASNGDCHRAAFCLVEALGSSGGF